MFVVLDVLWHWICPAGPLKKRGMRAHDVAEKALKDMRPTLLLFLRKLECVEASFRGTYALASLAHYSYDPASMTR